ncbi:hypothetical protein BD289DRAFT_288644 [Coniella lustricola]|uniref:Uncharacterized protein n=1 Tax=Coniella lustricola TaxID=2025994 RepID=A0A2T3A5K6_9PEZI|nr:hypothetical protein BD289DRAFT_288644 [Coniella lustricola]
MVLMESHRALVLGSMWHEADKRKWFQGLAKHLEAVYFFACYWLLGSPSNWNRPKAGGGKMGCPRQPCRYCSWDLPAVGHKRHAWKTKQTPWKEGEGKATRSDDAPISWRPVCSVRASMLRRVHVSWMVQKHLVIYLLQVGPFTPFTHLLVVFAFLADDRNVTSRGFLSLYLGPKVSARWQHMALAPSRWVPLERDKKVETSFAASSTVVQWYRLCWQWERVLFTLGCGRTKGN